jgi:hypothetical protein
LASFCETRSLASIFSFRAIKALPNVPEKSIVLNCLNCKIEL